MSASKKSLPDNAARLKALRQHTDSMLVEAGAGSGKTAVLAGRIAYMLADGVHPRSIAAVTFTELAASELLSRVREYVSELSTGKIAPELEIAFPDGLSEAQIAELNRNIRYIDEITCATIHGFCQGLIKPYPAEANIDPGATVTDRSQSDLVFNEIVDEWLRERLSGEADGVIAEMVLQNSDGTVALVRKIANNLRKYRVLNSPPLASLVDLAEEFNKAAIEFDRIINSTPVREEECIEYSACFSEMAKEFRGSNSIEQPENLVRILNVGAHPGLLNKSGKFWAYQQQGRWVKAAKDISLSKAEGMRLNEEAKRCYEECCKSWNRLQEEAASHVLSALMKEASVSIEKYRNYKRNAALLDFDDLIHSARDLLRNNEMVRKSLGERFSKVLVDEFQDTDPLQTEIFWRLCGDPETGASVDDWSKFKIRPGALFLVGDPKQAIYRFRGADVSAYVSARELIKSEQSEALLSISTNFRSSASILDYVNQRFEGLLSSEGQPGFKPLDAFHQDRSGPCVVALDVTVADETGKASAERQRDAEADAIAEMCARLIDGWEVIDRKTGLKRKCKPGDIALLAPTGTDLWRYEEALEARGIAVATQAGKGLFRRQEIQDLIALTRVLADRRDKLAFGAVLRGPIVGLTEEEILDIIMDLPRNEETNDKIPSLDLSVDLRHIKHPLARTIIEKLQALSRRSNATTPFLLLCDAVDELRLRPIILKRHQGQAERALSNVDLYLNLSRAYAVRGLHAFSESMTNAWKDDERAIEGRPDAQEASVALFTMHAAKGLEWPIVIPINTMTQVKVTDDTAIDREDNTFYCPVLGVDPAGYEDILEAEKNELSRERVRLWYVATTRARELLIIPRLDVNPASSSWIKLAELALEDLPILDVEHLSPVVSPSFDESKNNQTREIFAAEANLIKSQERKIKRIVPSKDKNDAEPSNLQEERVIWSDGSIEPASDLVSTYDIQGGLERGTILHKLMEEVLTGELADDLISIKNRSDELIRSFGKQPHYDPAKGLSPKELATCIMNTLELPVVKELRPDLLPEFPVYGYHEEDNCDCVTMGIIDAMTVSNEGRPDVVIDWKSDVAPTSKVIDEYRSQVRTYLNLTGAQKGFIVMLTSSQIIEV